MATLLDNRFTVGLWPLPGTAKRADLLSGIVTPGVGSFEFRPLSFENVAEAIANGDISSADDYIAPYQTFTLPVTAIPSLPDEEIISISLAPLAPLPAFSPFKAILEEPNPVTGASRTGTDEAVEIIPSPLWDPPLVREPYILTLQGSSSDAGLSATATISGYYTEKAFYDREWILRYPNAIAKISGEGVRYLRLEDIPEGEPLDPIIFDTAPFLPSGITPETWYAQTKADAEILDAPLMTSYLETCSDIISYKASEIRKLRYFYFVSITSTLPGVGFPIVTNIAAFMTVQNNMSYTQKRLTYALNIPKVPTPLPIT